MKELSREYMILNSIIYILLGLKITCICSVTVPNTWDALCDVYCIDYFGFNHQNLPLAAKLHSSLLSFILELNLPSHLQVGHLPLLAGTGNRALLSSG